MNFKIEETKFIDKTYNILDFGAKSDVKFNNQKAIQMAIDECNKNGGGMVLVPNGFYLTGPISIKSNVNFHLDKDAFIKFTKSYEEYPLHFTEYEGIKRIRAISPITIDNQENVAITGEGVIDGSGDLWRGIKKFKVTEKKWNNLLKISPYVLPSNDGGIWAPSKEYYDGVLAGEPDYNDPNVLEEARKYYSVFRPVMVSIVKSNKILLKDTTFTNSPAWNIHPLFTTNFIMDNCKIRNESYAQNGDGIDLESCKNAEIKNCIFEVGDDGICLKSGKNKEARKTKFPTENVYIHDCKVYGAHGGFVIGSEMSRGIKNVTIENCIFSGTDIGLRFKSAKERGGVVENININNIYMSEIINEAIIFDMGYKLVNIEATGENKLVDDEEHPIFQNINIDNISCDKAKMALKINGLPSLNVKDIKISNSTICANKGIDLKNCQNISLINTNIEEDGINKLYENEIFNA